MTIQIMGQTLLGLLLLAALLCAAALVRLGRRGAVRFAGADSSLGRWLRWLPWSCLLLAGSGLALAEVGLLNYHDAQDLSTLDWLVVGACLLIVADLCAALAWIALRDLLKATDSNDA